MGNREMALCCYCGKEVVRTHAHIHEDACVYGPTGERIKEFLVQGAIDGHMMGARTYRATKPDGLPSGEILSKTLGGWAGIARWAGLEYEPGYWLKQQKKRTQEMSTLPAMPESRLDIEEHSALAALHDWKPRTYTQQGRTYQELYITLR